MGGPIADNMIEASNTASNTHYLKMCRQFGADAHPARFPRQIPEFFIDFLTPNPPYDDWDRGFLDRPIVLDIFAGSNITGQIAEFKDRYWLAFERERKYVEISQFRFLTEEEISKRYNDDQSDFGDFTPLSSD
jgi:site-specific DNA-methyltransferase (cytosine-N4-specific)